MLIAHNLIILNSDFESVCLLGIISDFQKYASCLLIFSPKN